MSNELYYSHHTFLPKGNLRHLLIKTKIILHILDKVWKEILRLLHADFVVSHFTDIQEHL